MYAEAPCMFGRWVDWVDYRERMEAFKRTGIKPKQADLNENLPQKEKDFMKKAR